MDHLLKLIRAADALDKAGKFAEADSLMRVVVAQVAQSRPKLRKPKRQGPAPIPGGQSPQAVRPAPASNRAPIMPQGQQIMVGVGETEDGYVYDQQGNILGKRGPDGVSVTDDNGARVGTMSNDWVQFYMFNRNVDSQNEIVFDNPNAVRQTPDGGISNIPQNPLPTISPTGMAPMPQIQSPMLTPRAPQNGTGVPGAPMEPPAQNEE